MFGAERNVKCGLAYIPPLMYRDAEGRPTGLCVDLMKHFAEQYHWKLTFVDGTWNECVHWLKDGNIDILPSAIRIPSREPHYDFSKESIVKIWNVLIIPSDSKIKNVMQLSGQRIAILAGDVNVNNFTKLTDSYSIKWTQVPVESYAEVKTLVANRTVAGGLLNRFSAWTIHDPKIKQTDITSIPVDTYFMTAKGENSDLLADIYQSMSAMKNDHQSYYYRLIDSYMDDTIKPHFEPPFIERYKGPIIWTLGIASGFLVVIMIFLVALKAEVNRQSHLLMQSEDALKLAHEKEMLIGSKIQKTILMNLPPAGMEGVEMAQLLIAAKHVGGDFTDYYMHDRHIIDVVIADVMGKGVPGALLGAAVKHALYKAVHQSPVLKAHIPSVEDIVNHMNRNIVHELISLEQFVTLLYLRINTDTMKMDMVDCGHSLALWYQADHDKLHKLHSNNMPIGFTDREKFIQSTYSIAPGDLIVLYTDGIPDARNATGKIYGQPRFEHIFMDYRKESPEMILQALQNDLRAFQGNHPQQDDFSCIVIKILPRETAQPA